MARVTQLGIFLAGRNNNKREARTVLGLSHIANHSYMNRIGTESILSFIVDVPPIRRYDNKQRNWEAVNVYNQAT